MSASLTSCSPEPNPATPTQKHTDADADASAEDLLQQLDPVTPTNVPLPLNFFPACWHNDDERMSVLFAPFRSRSLNPLNFDTKLRFWTDLIAKYCQHKGNASCTIAELRDAFRRHSKAPYALDTVLEHLQSTGQTQTAAAFLVEPQHTWSGWAQKRLTAALTWPVHKVAASLWSKASSNNNRAAATTATGASAAIGSPNADRDPNGSDASDAIMQLEYIVMAVVCEQAKRLQRDDSIVGRVFDMDTLMALQRQRSGRSNNCRPLTEEGLRLVVHHLWCTKGAAVCSVSNTKPATLLVKIADGRQTNQQPAEITDIERKVYAVQRSVLAQRKLLRKMECEQEFVNRTLEQLLQENKKVLAKVQLRKLKLLDQKIGE